MNADLRNRLTELDNDTNILALKEIWFKNLANKKTFVINNEKVSVVSTGSGTVGVKDMHGDIKFHTYKYFRDNAVEVTS